MLNILQDFTGVNINTLRNQGRDKLESAFQNAAGAACGTIICSGNCQTKSLNGVSFATVAVETTCAVINTIGSINDITPSGLNSQIFTLWGLLLSALLFIIY